MLLINENIAFIELKQPIAHMRIGKPHIAENILRIHIGTVTKFTDRDVTFVKGKIKHEDHKTKEFFVWHKVFKNTEKIDVNTTRIHGWID